LNADAKSLGGIYNRRMVEQGNAQSDARSGPTPGRYDDDLRCPDCTYPLRGLTATNCPECGLDLGFIESEQSAIPWQHRRELGFAKAYLLTIWTMMFRWRIARKALYQPIDERAAGLFRGVTLALGATVWRSRRKAPLSQKTSTRPPDSA
jgi:hypothetical protein